MSLFLFRGIHDLQRLKKAQRFCRRRPALNVNYTMWLAVIKNHYASNGSMTCWAFLYLRTSAYGADLHHSVRIFQKNLNGGRTDGSYHQLRRAARVRRGQH